MQRQSLLEQLAGMGDILKSRPLTEEESGKKATLTLEFEELIKKEEISWRQKSRALWLKEGDRNSKFFHKVANAHKGFNNIDQLLIQGETTEEPTRIEEAIVEFCQNLYTENTQRRPTNLCPDCPVLNMEEKDALQRSFEEDEVLKCLKLCATDKVPGPDGYTMCFFL